jgi:hypothetical protein
VAKHSPSPGTDHPTKPIKAGSIGGSVELSSDEVEKLIAGRDPTEVVRGIDRSVATVIRSIAHALEHVKRAGANDGIEITWLWSQPNNVMVLPRRNT